MAPGEVDGRGDRIARQKEQRISSALNCRSGAGSREERAADDSEAVTSDRQGNRGRTGPLVSSIQL